MYGNAEADLIWLRLLDKYLVNKCNLKRTKDKSCILYRKDNNGRLELMMSVQVDDVSIAGNPEK